MDIVANKELLGDETEADLAEWLVADGDQVAEGQAIASVETSKVQVELESPVAGVIELVAAEGEVIELDAVLARVN